LPGAARGNDDALRRRAGAGDAMEAAAGAAVNAVYSLAVGIEMHQQAVRAWRRPRLLDAERLDLAHLHGLQTIARRGIGRRDPELGRHACNHLLAEIVLLEHELDQVRASGEKSEIEAAAAIGMQARGITGHVLHDDLRAGRAVPIDRQSADAMRPAL